MEQKGLLHSLNTMKDEMKLDNRAHQLDLNHLKHLDAAEAQKIRDEEKQQREWQAEIRRQEQAEQRKVNEHLRNKRMYDAGEIPKWKWNKMYPDGFPMGL